MPMIKARIPPEGSDEDVASLTDLFRHFSWQDIEKEFTCHSTGNLNIVQEAVDRWGRNREQRGRKALIFEKGGSVREFTYQEVLEFSSQWANLLIECGLGEGDRLFIFLERCPEVYFVMLACARIGVIFTPLYHTLSFGDLEIRLLNARPKAIVTHPDLARRLPSNAMASVDNVLLVDGPAGSTLPGEILAPERMKDLPKKSMTQWVRGSAPLYLMYTSSSDGPPKGVVHAHQDMLGLFMTGKHVLRLGEETRLWTDADPGWVVGVAYGTFAPWLCGSTAIVQGDPFSASNWYRTLERHGVEVWYTTPQKLLLLMRAGDDLARRYDLSKLKHIATVGEPLSPELVYWTKKALGHSAHDTWWMAETGMICIANLSAIGIKPGSMGKPVPGIEAAVLDEKGEPVPPLVSGELALKLGWPSLMTAVWQDPPRYQDYFRFKGWFLTGDTVTRDEEDYYYHQGRNDDLIKVGDKAVGPYEIEQMLSIHPKVAEAVAIAVGSPSGKTRMKVFVTPSKGFTDADRLAHEVEAFLSASFPPEFPLAEVVILDEMPKTRSGEPLRRVLRAREYGLPSGDVSKLGE